MASFAYAKVIERDGTKVYCEVCQAEGAAKRALSKGEYADEIERAAVVFTWGYSDGAKYVDLRALFCQRHPFCIALDALGPFGSSVPTEQLREVVTRICTRGRARWTTRAGERRFWYDTRFYDIALM